MAVVTSLNIFGLDGLDHCTNTKSLAIKDLPNEIERYFQITQYSSICLFSHFYPLNWDTHQIDMHCIEPTTLLYHCVSHMFNITTECARLDFLFEKVQVLQSPLEKYLPLNLPCLSGIHNGSLAGYASYCVGLTVSLLCFSTQSV